MQRYIVEVTQTIRRSMTRWVEADDLNAALAKGKTEAVEAYSEDWNEDLIITQLVRAEPNPYPLIEEVSNV